MNKLLLLIVEGRSDKTTLYLPLKNYIKANKLSINAEITNGDLSLKENSSKEFVLKTIEEIINTYKSNYSLFPSDFYKVVHIIDTDGCFVNDNSIYKLSPTSSYYIDDNNTFIYSSNINSSIKINSIKREIYKYLSNIDTISNVPYECLFFSRNLEHALYNKPNCSIQEKINYSDKFESEYATDKEGFYNKISESTFDCPLTYKESWDFIFCESNSLKRNSNVILLLNELKV